mmetsp:Transcript_17727/g.27367  ORF Transcript_17727/g.27367 Transcript_17727/m.27367 type:complete len:118 (+) Transcript_17727:1332-1685(+)
MGSFRGARVYLGVVHFSLKASSNYKSHLVYIFHGECQSWASSFVACFLGYFAILFLSDMDTRRPPGTNGEMNIMRASIIHLHLRPNMDKDVGFQSLGLERERIKHESKCARHACFHF